MTTAEEVVQRQVDAYNAHDIDAYIACYDSAAVVSRMASGEILAMGREQIARTWGYFFSTQPDAICKILSRFAINHFVIDHEEVTGLADRSVVRAAAIYEVHDNLITRVLLLSE